jgi:hypothetical protein
LHYRVLLATRLRTYWVSPRRQKSLFPVPLPRLAALPAPGPLRVRVHPLMRVFLFRARHAPSPAQHPQVPCAFPGVSLSIATSVHGVHCSAGLPTPAYVPPSAFFTLSTVFSSTHLAGLFHPATTYEIHSSGVVSRCQASTAFTVLSPHVVRRLSPPAKLPQLSSSGHPNFRVLIRAAIRRAKQAV